MTIPPFSLKGQIRSDTEVFLLKKRTNMKPEPLKFEEQLALFKKRGMKISDTDVKKIENIGYYRLKEFAHPLSTIVKKDGVSNIDYNGATFKEVISRYYQDKNLRIYLLHAIEKIEVSVKTKLSYILGEQYGAFGYLDFSKWGNRQEFSKFAMQEREYRFKRNLKNSMRKTSLADARNKRNQDSDGFPTVWLAMHILMFGELVNVIEVLSKKNQRLLASEYNCSAIEFVSWMKTLHFIRNVCAHNSNIIDIQIKTEAVYKPEWNKFLFVFENKGGGNKPTNRLAVVLLILRHFIDVINPKYNWWDVKQSIWRLAANKDRKAQLLGFKDLKSLKDFNRLKC